jgi:hypothetical protein
MIHVRVTFFLRYGLGVLVVFSYVSLDQGINIDWGGNVIDRSINIKPILLLFCIYLLFGDFVNLHIFSFYVFSSIRRAASLQCDLRRSSSSAWVPLGRGFRAYRCCQDQSTRTFHPCRLIGQIDWHALDIDLGISPLCLQIHFCINNFETIYICVSEITVQINKRVNFFEHT